MAFARRDFPLYPFPTDGRPVNVQEQFLNLTVEQIKDATAADRSQMVTVCLNLTSDFNKATVVRSHSAFLGNDIFMVGKRKFDKRGTVGSHSYNDIYHSPEIEPVIAALREDGYSIVGVDNNSRFECTRIQDARLPVKTAFIYGEESNGLDDAVLESCDSIVYVEQYGAAPRSLNVAAAASIAMYEYSRRHRP